MKKISVLIVEDSRICVEMMSSLLRKRGFYINYYQEAKKAIEEIENGLLYDIAIVDRSLGDSEAYSGDDVIDLSKKINPDIPVISFCGYKTKALRADGHLVKPVSLDRIIEEIKVHVHR
ncbi:MAG: response regulator [Nanoarchaeota archaeon]